MKLGVTIRYVSVHCSGRFSRSWVKGQGHMNVREWRHSDQRFAVADRIVAFVDMCVTVLILSFDAVVALQ